MKTYYFQDRKGIIYTIYPDGTSNSRYDFCLNKKFPKSHVSVVEYDRKDPDKDKTYTYPVWDSLSALADYLEENKQCKTF